MAADDLTTTNGEMDGTMLPVSFRVEKIWRETADTVSLALAPTTGSLPNYTPGQFNMVYTFGVGEIPISISGSDPARGVIVHTIREVGAVSRATARLAGGEHVGVRGPFGSGWPVAEAEGSDIIIIAGGLGLAPLRPAILSVLERRNSFGRVVILTGSRTPEDILFRSQLELWRQSPDATIRVTVDHADRTWNGHVGVVPSLIDPAEFDARNTFAFVCGPEIMMRLTARELVAVGIPTEKIYLSMERNMKCATGHCGHCQFGPDFVCRDGPVFSYDRVGHRLSLREI